MVRAALLAAVFSAAVAVVSPTVPAVDAGSGSITDIRLLAEMAKAAGRHTNGTAEAAIPVEVLTADDAGVAARITALGGSITGRVAGQLVQARVPLSKVRVVAGTAGVTTVQYPRRSGYVPGNGRHRTDLGPGVGAAGEEVSITNAAAWQAAGFGGAGAKVGIVDYFDFRIWNPTEHGTLPTVGNGHVFCRDTLYPAPDVDSLCNLDGSTKDINGDVHGIAVNEIVHDMAPLAEIFFVSADTTADLQAAIDWLHSKGVTIVTRSLGSPLDGPGDGTGPLDAVVDHAVGQGMTWFNSAGNDARDAYMVRTVPSTLGANKYVDFDSGPGVDTWLRIDGACVTMDGVRWSNDWYLPAAQRTDYSVEFWEPKTGAHAADGDQWNPTGTVDAIKVDIDNNPGNGVNNVADNNQRAGAAPLEANDVRFCPANFFGPWQGITFMRVKRNSATPVGTPDNLEIALAEGFTELGYFNTPGSASKPVVDSKNPGLVAVGAVDPPASAVIANYSSQGPTYDGRIKPDVSAPSGMNSWVYTNDGDPYTPSTFSGTSAASPTAAGMAALLQGAGLAAPGEGTAALVKHYSTDLGAPGLDNAFGAGKILLPAPPTVAPAATAGKFVPLALPARVLDTRPSNHIGPPALTGPYPIQSIIDFQVLGTGGVPASGVSAVAINLTSTSTPATGYLEAAPFMRAAIGRTSTLNISTAGVARPNFAIVPVGQDGKISVYLQAGGNAIIDVMGYYVDGQTTSTAGRFIPLADPERWMDTRGLNGAPLPAVFTGTPRRANVGETIEVPILGTSAVPTTGVSALVVNITATGAVTGGFLQAVPTGATGATHSNVNYIVGSAAANTAIVPLPAPGGTISVVTTQSTNIIVDVVGYITDGTAALQTLGLFMPITPGRAYNSRTGPPFAINESRVVQLTGLTAPAPVVPADAAGVSANLTVVNPAAGGFLIVYPSSEPSTSNLNFAAGKTVANAALLALNGSGQVTAKMSQSGHVLIDINGYFLAATI